MRERRFIGEFDLSGSEIELRYSEVVHQIKNVLRLKEGDEIVLCDGKGVEADSRIKSIEKVSIRVSLQKSRKNESEPSRLVTLYAAVLKRENFELVVQKATELGVHEIVPIITKRTIKLGLKMDRLQTIAREAAEQSGRGTIPILHKPISFQDAITDAKRQDVNLFFHIPLSLRGVIDEAISEGRLLRSARNDKKVGLWVGPEGGWEDGEVEQVKVAKFQMTSLGKLILRAETAAIASLSLVLLRSE